MRTVVEVWEKTELLWGQEVSVMRLACKKPKGKGGEGGKRRLQRWKGAAHLSHPSSPRESGPTPRLGSSEGWVGGCYAGSLHVLKLNPNSSPIPGLAKTCPQLYPQLPARLLQHLRLKRGQGRVLFRPRRGPGRQWRSRASGSELGASPDLRGACPRLALSRDGEEEQLSFGGGLGWGACLSS